jgi:hypothetical protein
MGERNIRIDNADSYDNLASVGKAMQDSGVPRANIFLTSKTGSPFPLGYDDTMSQFANVLSKQMVTYVDLLLSELRDRRHTMHSTARKIPHAPPLAPNPPGSQSTGRRRAAPRRIRRATAAPPVTARSAASTRGAHTLTSLTRARRAPSACRITTPLRCRRSSRPACCGRR